MRTFKQFAEAKIPKFNLISEDHPVRAAVVDIPTYWENLDDVISRLAEVLNDHGFTIVDDINFNETDYQGSYHLADKSGENVDSKLILAWHLLDSGRYEITKSGVS